MTQNDLISVVVPVFCVEKYLSRCVTSILNQEYENLEVILVDDGSPDDCPNICDAFARKDKRVSVIHKPNGGLSSARNAGIAAAAGKYIMLVDADDYIRSDMAGTLLHLIQRDQTDLAICSFRYVDEFERETRVDLTAVCPFQNGILERDELLGLIHTNVKGYWFYSVPFNKLYLSSILKKLTFPEQLLFEDEYLIHHLFGSIERASVSTEPLYFYTQRTDSITHTVGYDSMKKTDFLFALEDRYRYFNANGYRAYAKDTSDLLYTVFLKIMKNAFKSGRDYWLYAGKMFRISLILLRERKKAGIKLPFHYAYGWIRLCRRSSEK